MHASSNKWQAMHLYTHSTHAQLVEGTAPPHERMISSCSCAFFKRFNPRYRSSSLLLLHHIFHLTFKLHSNNSHVIVQNNTNLLFRTKPCIIPNNAWHYSDLSFRKTLLIPDSAHLVPCVFQSPESSPHSFSPSQFSHLIARFPILRERLFLFLHQLRIFILKPLDCRQLL